MEGDHIELDQIEVTISGALTTHHLFGGPAGELGELTIPVWSQEATCELIDGRQLQLVRRGRFSSRYDLLEVEAQKGSARPKGAFSSQFLISFGEGKFRLAPTGAFRTGWVLSDSQGTALLEVQPKGVLRQRAILTIHGAVDVDLLVFAYFLAYRRLQERRAAVAGAS